jgi:hypothetical protein
MSKLASKRNDIKWGRKRIEGSGNPNFNGGKYIDDKGYIRTLAQRHPHNIKGYVYEHRLVMEKFLNRILHTEEVIHHINEVKLDNRIDNLFLTSVAEHSRLHREGISISLDRRTKLRKNIRKKRKDGPPKPRDSAGKFSPLT